ncbi:MAG: hypothetical protein H6970_02165 [Gammaproteobacteria bacterium]|nr:hypothetical protein [Gammaproteobacteria bacterium]MCP5423866.1 hypothetical protein [Gammaproteobacteria bacterium]
MSSIRIPPNKQKGSALIISLIILVLMLIIGTSGMQTTILEERMSGNVRDYNNAFQASESGLLDGEQDIRNRDLLGNELHDDYFETDFTSNCNNSDNSLDGLCKPATSGDPQWERSAVWTTVANQYSPRSYGDVTGIPDLPPAGREQPDYIVERLDTLKSLGVGRVGYTPSPPGAVAYYRVTSRGFGIGMDDSVNPPRPLAQVMVQSIYGK